MRRFCGLCLLFSLDFTHGFQEAQLTHRKWSLHQLRSHRNSLEKQREELVNSLQMIDELKKDLNRVDSEIDLSKSRSAIINFEDEMAPALTTFVPPIGLSAEKYVNAMRLYLQLPPSIRYALVGRLNLEGETAGDYQMIPEIVARLYEEHTSPSISVPAALSSKTAIEEIVTGGSLDEIPPNIIPSLTVEANITTEVESTFRAFFGYLSRHTKSSPTSEEIARVMKMLKDEKFVSNGIPIEVPGAYVIPGIEREVNAERLLNCIDANMHEDWDCSVSLIYDVLDNELEPFEKPGCALLVFKNDFSTENSWLYYLSTLSALATSLLFSFSIFGKNEVFDVSSIDAIENIGQFLLPLFSILLLHELGHIYMAKKDGFKTRFLLPALLPFPQGLPLLGSLTRLTSSPSNLTSLFDFAVLGNLLSLILSLSLIFSGILLSSHVDGQAFRTDALPSIPVGVLKLSTLGGSLVDYVNGGSGFITAQESDTPVPLHPFFIAGYCGMIVSAVSLLPVGATDGGRLSLAIFGRQGHAVISGITWLALLGASLTLDDDQGRVLTTALVVNSLIQNDMEIPCRNETDEVDPKRLVLCFSLWFLAALILVPM
mmetsp:Transcript_36664/g.88859  ORF Transcript_36664/g.88859 Transcript_36664/m.88859 type:complete len:600 (+) Transcript_36664:42-1841(+)